MDATIVAAVALVAVALIGLAVAAEPAEADGHLDARVRAGRRGRHTVPSPAARMRGPLGLAAWYRRGGEAAEVLVYPDLPAAWRLVLAVRQGRFRDPGRLTRGPLGLGTDFESIRDYLPDDDFRQVNWRATARMGRPMSNQYRVEQDRDVVCMLDSGRLMAAPLGDRTRLDATVDAATAVALVADEVGDRAGVIAFDDRVRRRLPPARGAATPSCTPSSTWSRRWSTRITSSRSAPSGAVSARS